MSSDWTYTRTRSLALRAREWCESPTGGHLSTWWWHLPNAAREDLSVPVIAAGPHEELAYFRKPEDIETAELICMLVNYALDQLVPAGDQP